MWDLRPPVSQAATLHDAWQRPHVSASQTTTLLFSRYRCGQPNPPGEPCADMAHPDEIFNVWRQCLTVEQIMGGTTARTMTRLREQFHVFAPRLPPRRTGAEKTSTTQALCVQVPTTLSSREQRFTRLATSLSTTTRFLHQKRQETGGAKFTVDMAFAFLPVLLVEPCTLWSLRYHDVFVVQCHAFLLCFEKIRTLLDWSVNPLSVQRKFPPLSSGVATWE